jgi:hypothetical protein
MFEFVFEVKDKVSSSEYSSSGDNEEHAREWIESMYKENCEEAGIIPDPNVNITLMYKY